MCQKKAKSARTVRIRFRRADFTQERAEPEIDDGREWLSIGPDTEHSDLCHCSEQDSVWNDGKEGPFDSPTIHTGCILN
jgi:hypothetical protein